MPELLTIIIPTKNRPLDLEATLKSVFRQTVLPTQLVIVDQGQSDDAKRLVEELFSNAPIPIRKTVQLCYIRDTGISGLTVARNRAMEIARGDIWLFLDDDVSLDANFLEELLAVYKQYSCVSGVSGIISNYQRPPRASRLWSSVFVRAPFHDQRQPIYWKADELRNAQPIVVRQLGGGLMSFRAEAIRGHRFDENLRGVSDGEDVDFCVRLGPDAVLLIAPRARLVHKGSPIGRSRDHWLRRFSRANFYLYHRNWNNGLRNRLSFVWLNIGLGFVATIASLRRISAAPWRAFLEGARESRNVNAGATMRMAELVHSAPRILTTHPKGFHPLWSARTVLLPGWLDEENRTQGRPMSLWLSLYWGWKLFRASRNFDAVVTGFERSWHVFALLQKLLRRRKVPHVLVYFSCRRLHRPLKRGYYRLIVGALARIVVYSRHQIDMYAKELGLSPEKFVCVPYHTTLDGYHSSVYASTFPVSDSGYIFSGGDFKDYATLLEAVRGLRCRVIIAAREKGYFSGLNIPENVEVITASHEEFFRLMAGARIFVLPLHGGVLHPGGEQTYLNAMAMGKPVVVAADFGADEYITNGITGIIVPAGDPSALRRALVEGLENQTLSRDLGRAAKEIARKYPLERFIEGVLSVVQDCVH